MMWSHFSRYLDGPGDEKMERLDVAGGFCGIAIADQDQLGLSQGSWPRTPGESC